MELEVDVWLEFHLEMYHNSYIPFVFERNEKFLIFSIHFIFILEFSFIEIYEIFMGVRIKRY